HFVFSLSVRQQPLQPAFAFGVTFLPLPSVSIECSIGRTSGGEGTDMNASACQTLPAASDHSEALASLERNRVLGNEMMHLRVLEAEAIHILRETAAQFERPVLLYSIGKDSSVMLHLARKAFFPAKIPFPLMHIDTGYEYPEMIVFRDWFVTEIGARLIVCTN